MDTVRACGRCGRSLPRRHRKYCGNCSPLASVIWKRVQRRRWRGAPYALDPWLKKAGGDESLARTFRSEYMRRYRAAKAANCRPPVTRSNAEEVISHD